MAGTLPSIALSQRNDAEGRPLVGGKLYLYEAGTLTRATAFKDFNLTTGQEHPFPIVLDAWGQIPGFYLADGYYRARLTDSTGASVLFDELQIPAVGASDSSGGSTGTSVDPTAIFQTGDELWTRKSGARSGWVRGNGRTIGNASSGATERANSDTELLFIFYWNTFSNTQNAVVGGRGASAAADFAAGKQITLPDYRGRIGVGADDMGNSAAGRNADTSFATPTTVGSTGGVDRVTLTSAQIPAHSHTATASHTLRYDKSTATPSVARYEGGGDNTPIGTVTNTSTALTNPDIDITVNNSTGGGGAHNNMPPAVVGTWYVKL